MKSQNQLSEVCILCNECWLQLHQLNSCNQVFLCCGKNYSLLHTSHLGSGHQREPGCTRAGLQDRGFGGQVFSPFTSPAHALLCVQGRCEQCWPVLWMEAAVQHFSNWCEESAATSASSLLLFKTWAIFSIWSPLAVAPSPGFLLSLSLLD